jgi:hypothetical protein
MTRVPVVSARQAISGGSQDTGMKLITRQAATSYSGTHNHRTGGSQFPTTKNPPKEHSER